VTEKRKNLAILGVVVLCVAAAAALFFTRDFRLGLDLRGGLEVVLEARPKPGQTVTPESLQNAADIMRKRIDPNGVLEPEVRTSAAENQILVAVPGIRDPKAASELLQSTGELQSFNLFKFLSPVSSAGQFDARATDSLWSLLNRARPTIDRNEDVAGWALFNRENHRQLGRVEPTKAQVLEDITAADQPAGTVWRAVPANQQVVSCLAESGCPGVTATSGRYWYLFRQPPADEVITGDQVTAEAATDPSTGQPVVSLTYRNGGDDEFTRMTAELAQQGAAAGIPTPGGLPNAIVVDNELVSAPTVDYERFPNGIDATLTGGSEITGVSRDEAERVALEVQSGSLPFKFVPISSNNVSATLGKDSLRNGLIAGAAGLAFVMLFLLFFYGFLGLVADIALLIYGVLLAGVVLAIPVTLTLPGIAGMILTIGVAADANIVIFERIKEEVRAGRSIRGAISTGYRKGFHTIIDANVVTLITAVVLYIAATSSVKGFALMLLIGVVTSIFTAVVATRAMLSVLAGFRFMSSPRVLGSIGTGDRWKKYDLIGKWKIWFAFSGILIAIGLGSLATVGLNEGIDFAGGSRFTFSTDRPVALGDVRAIFEENGVDAPQVQGVGTADGDRFSQFRVQSHDLSGGQQTAVVGDLATQFGIPPADIEARNVSSSFGRSVLNQALLAIFFSLLIIFIYVSFRFEWKYAVPVMVALFHDILITIGVYSLTGREVTADTVAAVLTVLGYSLYDTVIVFDRVRENVPILRRATASQVVNTSLAEVITRSLNTSLVTLIPVIFLFVFGSGSLVDFAFALLVGIAVGAYSSIFVAAPLLALLLEREEVFAKRRRDLAAAGEVPAASAPAVATPVPAGARSDGGTAAAAATPERPAEPRRRRRRQHGRAR
jgi:SecD/SecF fusion protein